VECKFILSFILAGLMLTDGSACIIAIIRLYSLWAYSAVPISERPGKHHVPSRVIKSLRSSQSKASTSQYGPVSNVTSPLFAPASPHSSLYSQESSPASSLPFTRPRRIPPTTTTHMAVRIPTITSRTILMTLVVRIEMLIQGLRCNSLSRWERQLQVTIMQARRTWWLWTRHSTVQNDHHTKR
jgi:hypothetical protein